MSSTSRKNSVHNLSAFRAGFYAAGFWGPRQEEPDAAALRLSHFLQSLAGIQPMLAEWYFTISRSGALVSVPRSENALSEIIAKRMAWLRRGMDEETGKRMGAIVTMWAGDHSTQASLIVRLGNTDPRLGNAAVLKLPPALNPVFTDFARSRSVIEAIVASWDPDQAVLRPANVPRSDAPPLKPGQVVRIEDVAHQFPDWIAYKRNSPVVFGGPFGKSSSA